MNRSSGEEGNYTTTRRHKTMIEAQIEPRKFQVLLGGNKESGVGGREQGPGGIDFYSAWKTVAVRAV